MPFDRSLLVALCLVTGCIVAQPRPAMVGHQAVEAHPFHEVAHAPPPFAAPPPPHAPSNQFGPTTPGAPGQVWVDGHFNYVDNHYRWEPGHWQAPPAPGLHWQQPTWDGGRWFPGFWADQTPAPPVYAHQGPWNPGWNNVPPTLGVPPLQNVAAAVPTTHVGPTGARTVVVP